MGEAGRIWRVTLFICPQGHCVVSVTPHFKLPVPPPPRERSASPGPQTRPPPCTHRQEGARVAKPGFRAMVCD